MTFLAKAFGVGQRFLGVASKGASFLAKQAPNIQRGALAASSVVNSQPFTSLAKKAGISNNTIGNLQKGISYVGGSSALLPSAAQRAGALVETGKGNLAALYAQALK